MTDEILKMSSHDFGDLPKTIEELDKYNALAIENSEDIINTMFDAVSPEEVETYLEKARADYLKHVASILQSLRQLKIALKEFEELCPVEHRDFLKDLALKEMQGDETARTKAFEKGLAVAFSKIRFVIERNFAIQKDAGSADLFKIKLILLKDFINETKNGIK